MCPYVNSLAPHQAYTTTQAAAAQLLMKMMSHVMHFLLVSED
jgi:hypothetical protein